MSKKKYNVDEGLFIELQTESWISYRMEDFNCHIENNKDYTME